MLNKMRFSNAPITKSQISQFEVRYNLDLPISYQTFLLSSNGGEPFPAKFPIHGFPDNPYGVIQVFFGLNANLRVENLEVVLTDLIDKIPSGILPIACTEGDDFICLDLRKSNKVVAFWDRRPFWGNNVWRENDLYFIAENFESLLEKIH